MDQLVFAKSNALADAFTNLLAIHQGSAYPDQGRVWSRRMLHGDDQFMQYYLKPKAGSNEVSRYLCAVFYQWDGFFSLYCLTAEQMKPYQPAGDYEFKRGFKFEQFYRDYDNRRQLYTMEQVAQGAFAGVEYLLTGFPPPAHKREQLQEIMRYIVEFKDIHKSQGHVRLTSADIDALSST